MSVFGMPLHPSLQESALLDVQKWLEQTQDALQDAQDKVYFAVPRNYSESVMEDRRKAQRAAQFARGAAVSLHGTPFANKAGALALRAEQNAAYAVSLSQQYEEERELRTREVERARRADHRESNIGALITAHNA